MIDSSRLKQYDNLINFYSDLLNRWGLFYKRIETFEFLSKKPLNMDDKFGEFTTHIIEYKSDIIIRIYSFKSVLNDVKSVRSLRIPRNVEIVKYTRSIVHCVSYRLMV
jgi:hypothetical protein